MSTGNQYTSAVISPAEMVYDITINGVTLTGFKKVSEWEGLTKLSKGAGREVIVHGITAFDNFFDAIGKASRATEGKEITVVLLSQKIILDVEDALKDEKEQKQDG
jgi:hypothetical protein